MLLMLLFACGSQKEQEPTSTAQPSSPSTITPITPTAPTQTTPATIRVATFNVSFYGYEAGAITRALADGSWEKARGAASILQSVRPDIVLLNEFDWDVDGEAASAFHDQFLAVSQGPELSPLNYEYRYIAASNTGVFSGFDLDNSGSVSSTPGSDAYGGDSFGFGQFEGQYSFVVFSNVELESARTFQHFLWQDLPNADLPEDWYSADELSVVRLSSKNHVDLTANVSGVPVHLLVSHPTPPSFDGPEDRNGKRNFDEIRFWAEYIDNQSFGYHVDDEGQRGGLDTGEHFVILGDLNADPNDGGSKAGASNQLLTSSLINADPTPSSAGAVQQDELQGGRNRSHVTDPATDTTDFSDDSVGNLRIDYVLPSKMLAIAESGVFWPQEDEAGFEWVGVYPFPVTDHRLVWVDLVVPGQ